MAKITFDFSTNAFVRSHGKEPRGYGSWAFTFSESGAGAQPIWAPTSTYADAKKWVKNYVRSLAPADYSGYVVITVCT